MRRLKFVKILNPFAKIFGKRGKKKGVARMADNRSKQLAMLAYVVKNEYSGQN